ncbi:LysR family transcriptional regulator [Aggregatibacter segnis]|jgi:transcriptional regulator, lysR family|uniref:LysR family transcriptional regulator n=1 Tax=Aggregatibacter segnis TaxID=739 RepID=UPI000D6548F8|nr:LysR family transcriptional regulator [Aggregatibacter segnis]
MDQFKLIYIFAMILQHGSMNAAAPHLGMTASAISQAIRKLEAHFGVKLLNRTTRSLTPTAEGKQLQQYARQLIDWYDAVEREMGILQTEPKGDVRISLPTGYSAVEPMKLTVQTLHQNYPKIRLILNESNRLIDLQKDADIAIRAVLHPDDPDIIVRPLAQWQTLICASPDYLHKHSIAQPKDLLNADWLNHNSNILLHAFKCLGLPDKLPEHSTDCPDSSLVAREYACAGMGLAVLLSGDAAPLLENGKLSVVLPEYKLPIRTLYAATAHRTQSVKVRVVLDCLMRCFA